MREHRGEVEGDVSELGWHAGDVVQRGTGVVVQVRLHVAWLDLPGLGGEQARRNKRLSLAAHNGGARRQWVGVVKLLVARPRHGCLEVGDALVTAWIVAAAEVAARVHEEAKAPLGLPGAARGPCASAWLRRDLPWGEQPYEALHPPLGALVWEEAECFLAVDTVELGAQVVAVAEGIDDGGALGVALDGRQSNRLLALSETGIGRVDRCGRAARRDAVAGVSGNARLGDEREGPIRGDLRLEGENDIAREAAHRLKGRHVRERPEDPPFVNVSADGVVC